VAPQHDPLSDNCRVVTGDLPFEISRQQPLADVIAQMRTP
jgi:hypothetical protein